MRIDQRTVFVAHGEIDLEALAQGIEAGPGAGKFLAGDQHGIDRAGVVDRVAAGARQLGIDEFQVERGVVDDQRRVADEIQKSVGDVGEPVLAGEEIVRQAVDREGVLRHVAFRIEINVKFPAGRQVVLQFDGADLDDPVAGGRIEAGGFGVEDDLTHGVSLRTGLGRRLRHSAVAAPFAHWAASDGPAGQAFRRLRCAGCRASPASPGGTG